MRYRSPGLKSTDPKAAGLLPPGLSGRDMAMRMVRHPEHETGVTERGVTRRWQGYRDDLALAVIPAPAWHRDALCAEPAYAALSFFEGPKGKARKVCARCLVRAECLDDALSEEATLRLCYGIRGGLSGGERLQIIRQDDREHGTVYFGWGHGLIKIGTTRSDPASRAKVHGITLLATEPGSYTRERELHRRFADWQDHGEWFRPGDPLLDYIASLTPKAEAAA